MDNQWLEQDQYKSLCNYHFRYDPTSLWKIWVSGTGMDNISQSFAHLIRWGVVIWPYRGHCCSPNFPLEFWGIENFENLEGKVSWKGAKKFRGGRAWDPVFDSIIPNIFIYIIEYRRIIFSDESINTEVQWEVQELLEKKLEEQLQEFEEQLEEVASTDFRTISSSTAHGLWILHHSNQELTAHSF